MSNAPCQPKPFKASGTTIADPSAAAAPIVREYAPVSLATE
ncbi:hypothetical protein EC2731150_2089 [Escherichia coli 2731150]|nr:hypothetical protein [Escherichia coli]EMW81405.1 hypothetical protein EC2731150_2089 [Escherichia coli 2731150]